MPKKTGFATLPPEEQRRLARLGGKAAHAQGNAHEWTTETAKRAGRLGGIAMHAKAKSAKIAAETEAQLRELEELSEASKEESK